jgi:hypothetical protein
MKGKGCEEDTNASKKSTTIQTCEEKKTNKAKHHDFSRLQNTTEALRP